MEENVNRRPDLTLAAEILLTVGITVAPVLLAAAAVAGSST
jgi:hypothetical protein